MVISKVKNGLERLRNYGSTLEDSRAGGIVAVMFFID
jgi:hypothetical protein